jgi:TRAP-type C4-dicarboxylate transport system permease small subunit
VSGAPSRRRTGAAGIVECVVTWWALAGGFVLLAIVAMTVYSVVAGALFNAPFPGDFELVEMGVAIAAFAFLPYCQLVGANVTADIFTMKASRTTVAAFALIAAVIALGFSLVLLWRMAAGLLDYYAYEETTAILQIPHWIAFVPILISLALLAVAAFTSLVEAWRDARAARAPEQGSARA